MTATPLEKAKLQEVSNDAKSTPIGKAVNVQFNPTTLRVKLSNSIEGGKSRGRQKRQYIGSSSSVLTLELVFDTADEGTTAKPRSVREKTNFLESFVLPTKAGAKETPPRLQFSWGDLIFQGIVESLGIDYEYFASNGTPLRAKASLSIKEQKAEYQFLEAGAGAKTAENTKKPGDPPASAVGSKDSAGSDQSAPALGGETPAEFASRMGLDPGAWRGLDVDLGASLALDAGVEVGFSAGLSAGAGVGINLGVEAGADLSLEAAFGLEVATGVSAGSGALGGNVGAEVAAGFALSAAGGVSAAHESVKIVESESASQAAREAFAAPVAAASGTATRQQPARPDQPRTPLITTGPRSPAQQQTTEPAPPPPRADARAATYGFGIPLRGRITVAAMAREGLVHGNAALNPESVQDDWAFRTDPTTPPWLALPPLDSARSQADALQQEYRRKRCCGCLKPCKPRGAKP